MRILLLGASGKVGRWFGRLATERGHQVTALVRPTTKYDPPPGARVVPAQVTDPDVLPAVLPGHDVVVSCLGLKRRGKHPWARLLSPPDLVSSVTHSLVALMPQAGVRRIALLSAGGVGGTRFQSDWMVKRMIDAGNIRVAYRDLARAEEILRGSRLDCLIVQPVTLVNGAPSGRAADVVGYGMLDTIRRGDVAKWMLREIEGTDAFTRHVRLIGTI